MEAFEVNGRQQALKAKSMITNLTAQPIAARQIWEDKKNTHTGVLKILFCPHETQITTNIKMWFDQIYGKYLKCRPFRSRAAEFESKSLWLNRLRC